MAELEVTFRDHFLSVYQSAAADYARQVAAEPGGDLEAIGEPNRIAAAADRVAELHDRARTGSVESSVPAAAAVETEGVVSIAGKCAELGFQLLQASVVGDVAKASRLKQELALGTCDPRWADTVLEYAKHFGVDGTRGTIPYIKPAQAGETVIRIKAGARIGLIGDWGTGAAPAVQVLKQMEKLKPDVLVHLGDIYYSGTDEECRTNFEAVVDRVFNRTASQIPVYTLAGNHDMYSGGAGYYALLTRLNDGALRQRASYFCLRTEDDAWQLLGMDTGLHDYSPVSVTDAVTFVEAEEQEWHRRRIAEFAGKSILLSHHQLFSRYSGIGNKDAGGNHVPYNKSMKTMFDSFLSIGKAIPAWFWGHEHNLGIYTTYLGLRYGRCLGHSAVPVLAEQDSYQDITALEPLPEVTPGTRLPMAGNTYVHGFAMLTLGTDGKAKVDYFNTDNAHRPFFSEVID